MVPSRRTFEILNERLTRVLSVKKSLPTTVYGRAEVSAKQIFGLGLHPAGYNHPHFYSHIDPLTVGLRWRPLRTSRVHVH